jgi:tetratricopeptide (TPR) repeat protein
MRSARSIVLLASLAGFLWCATGPTAAGGIPYYVAAKPNRPAVEGAVCGKGDSQVALRIRTLLRSTTSPAAFSLNPLEDRLFADAADGRWDDHSLLAASLVASGVSDRRQVGSYEDKVARLIDELRRSGVVAGSPRQKAEAIFEFLHRRVLVGGYQLDATDLALVLNEGRFNCVSASVLFNCLAESFGLRARGLEIPGHAMSRLLLPEGPLDVETTCPEWFRLLGDPKKQAELVEKRLGVRPKDEPAPREVSDVELVATIYYNRGVDLLAQKEFAQAVAANAKALELDPSSATARGNLLATLNNWAIELGAQGRYAEAVELLSQGLAIDPGYATFRANFTHVHYQWVQSLCHDGQFQRALDILTAGAATVSGEPYFVKGRLEVYRRWVRQQFASDQAEAAFELLTEARRVFGDSRQVRDVEAAEVTHRAAVLLDERRFAEAVALFDRGLARQPDSAVLRQNRQTTIARWAEQSDDPAQAAGAAWGNRPPRASDRSI